MKYTEAQYIELAKRFNSKSILAKLITIKTNPDVFKLFCDSDGRLTLRLVDDAANQLELDLLFDFQSDLIETAEGIKALFELVDIKLH
jgi:hypothetical protein